ncbi:MAG: hypothetical protein ABIS36_17905 [Chryseolinea sp.]
MNQDISFLQHISGQLVGISKITTELMKRMASFAEKDIGAGSQIVDDEDVLVGSSAKHEIFTKVIHDIA